MNDIAYRLRKAREDAGFATASEAAKRHGWTYPTYAGHENGSRGIDVETLGTYARAFRVTFEWLGTGRSTPQSAPSGIAASGFSEPDVAPFRGKTTHHRKTVEDLARAITPGSRHQMIYQTNRDYAAFGILKDDLLVIGSPNGGATDHIVVATLADPVTGEGHTALRQLQNDALVAPLGHALEDEDKMRPAVMGHVLAVIRAPQITR